MARYLTHTDPPLVLKWENNQVALDCEQEDETPAKVLYPKPGQAYDLNEAKSVYQKVRAMYEQRKKSDPVTEVET